MVVHAYTKCPCRSSILLAQPLTIKLKTVIYEKTYQKYYSASHRGSTWHNHTYRSNVIVGLQNAHPIRNGQF
nr:MAG TPA: hypothetical protein [Caudoviricetes sp.]